jgi:hypothetical protein
MGNRRRLEREIREVAAAPRIPARVPVVEVERWLEGLARRGGPVRAAVTQPRWWQRGEGWLDYAASEPWEVVARLGVRDVANVLVQRDPVGYAGWRADGRSAAGDLGASSAYRRLAQLAEQGFGSRGPAGPW